MSDRDSRAGDTSSSKREKELVFAAAVDGARAAGDFIAADMREKEPPCAADRAPLVTYLRALRLIRGDQPSASMNVVTAYSESYRPLRIQVGDGHSVLDSQDTEEGARSALSEYVDDYWADDTASGRAMACKLAVRRAYRVRSAWYPASGVVLAGVDLGASAANGSMRLSGQPRMIGAAA